MLLWVDKCSLFTLCTFDYNWLKWYLSLDYQAKQFEKKTSELGKYEPLDTQKWDQVPTRNEHTLSTGHTLHEAYTLIK